MGEDNERSHLYEKDDLANYADLSNVDGRGSEYGLPSRSDLLEMALGVEPTTVSSGGYQGTYLFIFVVEDTLWLLKDSYGSCSYCDGLLSQRVNDYSYDGSEEEAQSEEDENLRQYAESMMNNAYAFTDKNDAVWFLHEKTSDGFEYGWGSVAPDGIEKLSDVEY